MISYEFVITPLHLESDNPVQKWVCNTIAKGTSWQLDTGVESLTENVLKKLTALNTRIDVIGYSKDIQDSVYLATFYSEENFTLFLLEAQ